MLSLQVPVHHSSPALPVRFLQRSPVPMQQVPTIGEAAAAAVGASAAGGVGASAVGGVAAATAAAAASVLRVGGWAREAGDVVVAAREAATVGTGASVDPAACPKHPYEKPKHIKSIRCRF